MLPRQLDRGLHPLAAAGDEVGVGQSAGGMAHQHVGQRLGRLIGEKAGVGIGEPIELAVHRSQNMRVAVSQASDGRPARAVHHPMAIGAGQPDALAGDGGWGHHTQIAVNEMGHVRIPTVAPTMQQAMVAANRLGQPSRTISARLSGHIALMPPSMMPREPMLVKPHRA